MANMAAADLHDIAANLAPLAAFLAYYESILVAKTHPDKDDDDDTDDISPQ